LTVLLCKRHWHYSAEKSMYLLTIYKVPFHWLQHVQSVSSLCPYSKMPHGGLTPMAWRNLDVTQAVPSPPLFEQVVFGILQYHHIQQHSGLLFPTENCNIYKIQDTTFITHLNIMAKLIIRKLHHYTNTTEGSPMEWNLSHSPPVILSYKWWLWKSCFIKCFGYTDTVRQCWNSKKGRSTECNHSQHPRHALSTVPLITTISFDFYSFSWMWHGVIWQRGHHCFGTTYCLYLPQFFQMLAPIIHTTRHHILEDNFWTTAPFPIG
jgi:hypothetical protein